MGKIVKASIKISRIGKPAIVKSIQIKDYTMSDFLLTINTGDMIKLKGLMALKVNAISTVPVKDISDNWTLSEVIFYCTVGDN